VSDVIKTYTRFTTGSESLDIKTEFDPDPSAATPQFGIGTSTTTPPGTYVDGAWKSGSTWSATTGRIDATTPTIGAAGGLVIAAGATYHIWSKVTVGSETFIRRCATVVCPA